MNKSNYLIFLVVLISFIAGCKKDEKVPAPIVAFISDTYSVEIDQPVTFTNISKNAESYSWSFGDGETSTEENPTHIYKSAGIFEVTLVGTNTGGSNLLTVGITVTTPTPVTDFTISKSVAEIGESITFNNTSTYAESYEWDFGDGNVSTEKNPIHTFLETGSFEVKLKALGEGGENTISKTIKINVATTIFPGIGILNISLSDSWSVINSKIKNNSYEFIELEEYEGFYVKTIHFEKQDIVLRFVSGDNTREMTDTDNLYDLYLYDLYIGKTEKNIQIGSLLTSIEEAYGEPSEKKEDYYAYDNLGISFIIKDASASIIRIHPTVTPSSSNKTLNKKEKSFINKLNNKELMKFK